jgi:hypothetical protein
LGPRAGLDTKATGRIISFRLFRGLNLDLPVVQSLNKHCTD